MDNVQELKRIAVNAMTGFMPCTSETLYDLGKALEQACEEIEELMQESEEAV